MDYDFESMAVPNSFSVLKDMFFAYNLILHFPIILTNVVIIAKEIQLTRIQLFANWTGGGYTESKYGLEAEGWHQYLSFLNPMWWLDLIWEIVFGYSIHDIFMFPWGKKK